MTKKELAKQILVRRIEEYEKSKRFNDKKELDDKTFILSSQVKTSERIGLINTMLANEYLLRLERKYKSVLHSEQFKEYREQVLNFNDDFITARERLFIIRKKENDDSKSSLQKWNKEVGKKSSSFAGFNNNERTEIMRTKDGEREEEVNKA